MAGRDPGARSGIDRPGAKRGEVVTTIYEPVEAWPVGDQWHMRYMVDRLDVDKFRQSDGVVEAMPRFKRRHAAGLLGRSSHSDAGRRSPTSGRNALTDAEIQGAGRQPGSAGLLESPPVQQAGHGAW